MQGGKETKAGAESLEEEETQSTVAALASDRPSVETGEGRQ